MNTKVKLEMQMTNSYLRNLISNLVIESRNVTDKNGNRIFDEEKCRVIMAICSRFHNLIITDALKKEYVYLLENIEYLYSVVDPTFIPEQNDYLQGIRDEYHDDEQIWMETLQKDNINYLSDVITSYEESLNGFIPELTVENFPQLDGRILNYNKTLKMNQNK